MSLLSFLPILIIISGLYLLKKLDFFFIKHPIRTLKFTFSGENNKKSLLSLLLALAGTLGVGNISGVAIGIAVGGAGSVFWLILSALFSSAIKYSEVYISYRSRGIGMISVIKSSYKTTGDFFAYIYAFVAVVLSFSMGSVFQARAISESASNISSLNITFLASVLSIFVSVICLLGKDRIKHAVAFIIPIATLIYTGMCLTVVFRCVDRLPATIYKIFNSAFSFKSASGGFMGFIVSSGMKEGFARGLLSNEAGAGTSSFSHTSHIENIKNGNLDTLGYEALLPEESCEKSRGKDDVMFASGECQRAGVFGILEVVFDTLLLCPLTALAILLGSESDNFSGSLAELSEIFENRVGAFAPSLLFYSIIFFAISTTLCWYYYGKISLGFITKGKGIFIYSALFFISFFTAVLKEIPHTLFVTDTALFILSIISLSCVIKNRTLLRYEEALCEK